MIRTIKKDRRLINKLIIVSPEDEYLLECYRWRLSAHGYPVTTLITCNECGSRKTINLHSFIVPSTRCLQVDHANRNKLDQQNAKLSVRNTSGFKGVSKRRHGWEVNITSNGTRHYLGLHSSPEEAHFMYCMAAVELNGGSHDR